MLGAHATLEVHHIFPKKILYDHGYSKRQVNALANFTFLTKETNLEVTDRAPDEYISAYEQKKPGSVASHWMPMEPALRHPDRYLDFLAERRRLLATAANEFLDSLLSGDRTVEPEEGPTPRDRAPVVFEDDEEEARVRECAAWALDNGLAQGIASYELADPASGAPVAVLDLAWPDGLQAGLTEPVALLLGEPPEVEQAASRFGFRYFTDVEAFESYARAEILGEDDDAVAGAPREPAAQA